MWCSQCGGEGHISASRLMWILSGGRLSEMRSSLGLSMAEAAGLAHVNLLAWNDAEHGRADPGPLLRVLAGEGATA